MCEQESIVGDMIYIFFFFSSRRRHTRLRRDWSSDVCSSDLRMVQMQVEGLMVPLEIMIIRVTKAMVVAVAMVEVLAQEEEEQRELNQDVVAQERLEVLVVLEHQGLVVAAVAAAQVVRKKTGEVTEVMVVDLLVQQPVVA